MDAPSSIIPEEQIFTVEKLTQCIKDRLESDKNLANIWVRGEISSLSKPTSGHYYFNLKDDNNVIRCVMFRGDAQDLKFEVEHGQKVLLLGSIKVYPIKGDYQIIVSEMNLDGIGILYQRFLQLKEKLNTEGLFKKELKKKIPKFPKVVGIVTSPTGAAIRDIISILKNRWPNVHIRLAPAIVQGAEGIQSIVDAIQLLDNMEDTDTIIIARGGGSLEDLWCFNEETVARAIFNANTPIISGVGHETDFTIADFVADSRAETPSVAAEKAVPNQADILQLINNSQNQMRILIGNLLQKKKQSLIYLIDNYVFRKQLDFINQNRQTIDELNTNIMKDIKVHFDSNKQMLYSLKERLRCLDPKAILSRGYSIVIKEDKIVKNTRNIFPGEILQLIVENGEIITIVQEVKENE